MKYRKLRIAWSVAWGIVCLLLIALWARSFWQYDDVRWGIAGGSSYNFLTRKGEFYAGHYSASAAPPGLHHWAGPISVGTSLLSEGITSTNRWKGFAAGQFIYDKAPVYYFVVPMWFTTGVAAALCTTPWIRWSKRFSLRTLLIALTAAAFGLGWIVYAIRK